MSTPSRIQQLLQLLGSEPQDVFLNYALGIEYSVQAQQHDFAEVQFKKVLELDAEYLAVYYQLGKLYEAKQQIQEALHYFKIGLEKAKQQKNNKAINEFGEAVFMLED